MKQIPAIDKQFETRKATDSGPVLHGYANARDRDLELMILDEFSLYAETVPSIVESLRNYGIEQVAVTSRGQGNLELMWAFNEEGATFEMDLVDTGRIEDRYTKRFVPGFIITLN